MTWQAPNGSSMDLDNQSACETNMEFLDMHWSDFKSFTGEHNLDFRKYGPGLYFIRGENQAEPELGSNGAAKSTLLDVIHWTLFGTSIRGTRSPQLVPWKKSGNPKATLRIKLDETMTIQRTYKPTTLTIKRRRKKTPVTQEQLEDLLGLTSDTFQSSIVIGQFSQMFFDLKPREKMSVFSELLDLDYWLVCSDHARTTLMTLREDESELQRRLDRTDVLIEEIRGAIAVLRKEQATDAKVARGSIVEIKKRLQSIRTERHGIQERQRKLKKKLKVMRLEEKKQSKQVRDLECELGKVTSRMNIVVQQHASLRASLKMQEKQSTLLATSTKTNTCPTCGQQITGVHRRHELRRLAKIVIKIRSDLTAVKQEHGKLDVALTEGTRTIVKTRSDLSKLPIGNLELALQKCEHEERETARDAQQCEEKLETLKGRREQSTTRLRQQVARLTKVKEEYATHRRALQESGRVIEQTRYWVQGFKDIRLFEIGEAITALEVEINSYLIDLGMERWTVHLDVERETKSGSISRGFQVTVDPGLDMQSGPRSWEAWSGGEGQRLRLAGTLALSNLILRQFDRSSNLQFWDEKLTFLSGTGEDDMLSLLRETALREDKQIWVIDQHNLDYNFDDTLTIVKDNHGSRLVP